MLPMSVFVLLPLAWLACSGAARAGASLEVDDAAITPEGRCQVESWLRRERGALQATAVPACGVHGSEIGLGLSARRPADVAVDVALGLKRVLRPLGEGGGGRLADTRPERPAAAITLRHPADLLPRRCPWPSPSVTVPLPRPSRR